MVPSNLRQAVIFRGLRIPWFLRLFLRAFAIRGTSPPPVLERWQAKQRTWQLLRSPAPPRAHGMIWS